MQQKKIHQIANKALFILIIVLLSFKSFSQKNKCDSIQVFALNFGSLYYIRLDATLIKDKANPFTIKDTISCDKILADVLNEEKNLKESDKLIKGYNPNLMDLRLLLLFYKKSETIIVAFTYTGRYFRVDQKVYRYEKEFLKILSDKIPELKEKIE